MFSKNRFVDAYRGVETNAMKFLSEGSREYVAKGPSRSFVFVKLEYLEREIADLDKRVRAIVREEGDVVMWNCHMRACGEKRRLVVMNLAIWGSPEFDLTEIVEAMSYIRTVADNTKAMLKLHEPKDTSLVVIS